MTNIPGDWEAYGLESQLTILDKLKASSRWWHLWYWYDKIVTKHCIGSYCNISSPGYFVCLCRLIILRDQGRWWFKSTWWWPLREQERERAGEDYFAFLLNKQISFIKINDDMYLHIYLHIYNCRLFIVHILSMPKTLWLDLWSHFKVPYFWPFLPLIGDFWQFLRPE